MEGLRSLAADWFSSRPMEKEPWGAPTEELDEYRDQDFVILPEAEIPVELKVWYQMAEEFSLRQGGFYTHPICYPKGFFNDLGAEHDGLTGDGYFRIYGRYAGGVYDDCGPYLAIRNEPDQCWGCFASSYKENAWLRMSAPLDEWLTTLFLGSLLDRDEFRLGKMPKISKLLQSDGFSPDHLFCGTYESGRLSEDPKFIHHWTPDPNFWYSSQHGLILRGEPKEWEGVGIHPTSPFANEQSEGTWRAIW